MTPAPQPYMALCAECHGQNPRCARCLGAQYVVKHPYAAGAGEQGDEVFELVTAMRRPPSREAVFEKALRSIAANSCCAPCREAALVARAALEAK